MQTRALRARKSRTKAPSLPKTAEDRYALALRRVAAAWARDAIPKALSKAKKVAAEETRTDAADTAKGAISKAASDVSSHVSKEYGKLGIKLSGDSEVKDILSDWSKENAKLVKGFLDDEAKSLAKIVREGEGRRWESLSADIRERFQICQRRADLIARDQVLSLNAKVTEARNKAVGIEEYEWLSLRDEKVRKQHRELDGQRFRYDDPPVCRKNGERGHPGHAVGCRCQQRPILPGLDDF